MDEVPSNISQASTLQANREADIPSSPGNIPSSHPLMVRHADHSSLTLGVAGSSSRLAQGMGRSQRTLRQLTANSGHTIHVHYPHNRQPNPPLILQRLLGPSAAADILQLSSSLPLQSRGRARLLVGNEDVHIIARSDDELLDDFFHEQSSTGGQAEGEQAQEGPMACLDTPRVSEGFITAPPSGEVTPTTPAPHEQALVSLETAISQQVHQPIADLLLAESHASSLAALAGAGLPTLSETLRPNTEAEASQMEMSPAPTTGISLPEGVDPSFLAALPEDIRREVLQNQLGIRPPSRPPAATTLPSSAAPVLGGPGVTEVLAQQRAEQQRRELAQQPPQGDTPLDPVTFIQTLPSELRRSVLEDMEDSVLAVMPPDIAAEAAALRREQEARQRQLMHERLFGHSSSSALSAILRSPAFTSRLGSNRGVQYTRLAVQRGGPFQMGGTNHR
ncbi:hypothetical protein XENOCAPTIV_025618 [Xenoophorus captivus]|uniref:Uncharacterized protein n=1 Tax=Xenoophorus captivus TaxID=1517983 RepID=A0ABV0SBU3_9TELE